MTFSSSASPWSRSAALVAATALLVSLTGPVALAADAGPLVAMTVEGTIENVVVEHDGGPGGDAGGESGADGETAVETFLQVDDVLYDVPASVVVPEIPTGTDVVITLAASEGISLDDALDRATEAAPDAGARVLDVLPAPSEPASPAGAETADAAVLGGHTLTILPVTWGAADVSTTVLGNLASATAAYWSEQSGGRISITPSVRAWTAIADPGSCSVDTIYNVAMSNNPGVGAASLTNHVVVYFPYRADCPFAGRGSLLGGKIWVNGSTAVDVTAHELGHNLGLGHANQSRCTSTGGVRVSLSGSCTTTEYADSADLMGFASYQTSGNLNSALADSLGFAQVTQVPAGLATAIAVDLAPLAAVFSNRGVKIRVPAGDVYVDFRPAVGRDVRRPAWAGVQVHLRTTDRWGIPTTYLLDMQPTTPTAFSGTALPAGATWVVPDTGLMVTVTGTDSVAHVQVAPTVALEQYVTRVYSDLFSRVPDPQGLLTWTNALRTGTPRIAVANAITYSAEYRSGLIAGSYRAYLAREPDAAGLASWLDGMSRGLMIQQMEGGFLASAEYYAQSGGDPAAWISRLYRHVLGRDAAASEVQSWVSQVSQGTSRYIISMGFLLSTERLTTVVNGHYGHLLGRGIDPSGAATWVGLIQGGTRIEAIIGGIIASEEYYGWR